MARPDLAAREESIYRNKKRESQTHGIAKTAALAAIPYSGLTNKLMPFLESALPADLALKGIKKISPRLGKILEAGKTEGLDLKEGIDFFKNNLQRQPEQNKEDQGTIKKYSDKLFQFLRDQIGKGRSPLEAGALAQNMKEFRDPIKKIQKDLQRNWSDILTDEFGEGVMNNPSEQEQPQESDNWEDTIIQKMQALRSM